MANKRMFSLMVIDSDSFLDMPLSTQALYFHLCMRADDDGFVSNPKKILRMVLATEDDLKLLIAKQFLIPFDSGVIVIKHWKVHNVIRSDTKHDTLCSTELASLEVDKNGMYQNRIEPVTDTVQTRIEPVTDTVQNQPLDKVSIGKDSIDKVRTDKDRLDKDNLCSEPQGDSEPEARLAPLVLNDGSLWRPLLSDYQEWERVYPNVNVAVEFERMRQWCISNPTKRKTKRGIRRFVTNWLDSEQNKPRRQKQEVTGADAFFELAEEAMNGTG